MASGTITKNFLLYSGLFMNDTQFAHFRCLVFLIIYYQNNVDHLNLINTEYLVPIINQIL